mmetsp:Transcript_13855/g.39418  ORF Transcript_13855/g.39418 Transcript_13855/m.39418 type:complete len:323 (-) Transcript_13855:424-1392(-)
MPPSTQQSRTSALDRVGEIRATATPDTDPSSSWEARSRVMMPCTKRQTKSGRTRLSMMTPSAFQTRRRMAVHSATDTKPTFPVPARTAAAASSRIPLHTASAMLATSSDVWCRPDFSSKYRPRERRSATPSTHLSPSSCGLCFASRSKTFSYAPGNSATMVCRRCSSTFAKSSRSSSKVSSASSMEIRSLGVSRQHRENSANPAGGSFFFTNSSSKQEGSTWKMDLFRLSWEVISRRMSTPSMPRNTSPRKIPYEKTSASTPTATPYCISGALHQTVPTASERSLPCRRAVDNPKSHNFARPCSSSRTFSALMSLCNEYFPL